MSMLVVNKIMFMHVHKMEDGTVIAHSHPYNKTDDSKPFKTHRHTIAEFLFLNNFEIFFLVILLALALIGIARKAKYSIYSFSCFARTCIILHKGRAPPVL
ncbi:MAG: hypothetical protein K8R35_02715 [Bacteroidales bacterium]|nr:hypothetical protein [Bacteroidales bacterium]